MKVAVVFLAALAIASAMPQKSSGWQKATPKDKSKYKTVLPLVTPKVPAHIHLSHAMNKHAPKPIATPAKKAVNADCGIMGPSGRIVGGDQANQHQFPWQVGIFMDDSYFCGGSIIGEEWIMTAAHCADGFSKWEVHIGAHEIFGSAHDTVVTREAIIHPDWDSFNLAHDIALLKVPAITFDETAMPICLPHSGEVGDDLVDEIVTISGWGRESDSSSGIAEILNYVTAPVMTNQACNDVYGIVGDGVICIDTEGGQGTCNGDSGGPMVRDRVDSGVHTQYGVVSFGASAGCEAGYPAGFSRVTYYLDFIQENTGIQF